MYKQCKQMGRSYSYIVMPSIMIFWSGGQSGGDGVGTWLATHIKSLQPDRKTANGASKTHR